MYIITSSTMKLTKFHCTTLYDCSVVKLITATADCAVSWSRSAQPQHAAGAKHGLNSTGREANGVRLRQVTPVTAEAQLILGWGAEPSLNELKNYFNVKNSNTHSKVITYISHLITKRHFAAHNYWICNTRHCHSSNGLLSVNGKNWT